MALTAARLLKSANGDGATAPLPAFDNTSDAAPARAGAESAADEANAAALPPGDDPAPGQLYAARQPDGVSGIAGAPADAAVASRARLVLALVVIVALVALIVLLVSHGFDLRG